MHSNKVGDLQEKPKDVDTTNWYWNTCRWCAHRVTGTYQEEYRYPMIEKERVEELFYTPTMRTDQMSVNRRKKEICSWQLGPIAKSSAKSRERDSAAYLLHHILPPTCFYPDATPNLNHAAYFQLVYTHLTWKIFCCVLHEQADMGNILIWFSGYWLEFLCKGG